MYFLPYIFLFFCVSFGAYRGTELPCILPDSHAASSRVFADGKRIVSRAFILLEMVLVVDGR